MSILIHVGTYCCFDLDPVSNTLLLNIRFNKSQKHFILVRTLSEKSVAQKQTYNIRSPKDLIRKIVTNIFLTTTTTTITFVTIIIIIIITATMCYLDMLISYCVKGLACFFKSSMFERFIDFWVRPHPIGPLYKVWTKACWSLSLTSDLQIMCYVSASVLNACKPRVLYITTTATTTTITITTTTTTTTTTSSITTAATTTASTTTTTTTHNNNNNNIFNSVNTSRSN